MNTPSPNSMKRDPGRGSAYLSFLRKRCRDFFFFCLLLGVYVAFITLTGIGCPIRFFTGISCPGCGMSRAVLLLLSGHFQAAFRMHPLVYAVLPAGIWLFFGPEQTAGLLYVSNNIDRIADRSDEIREVLEQNRAGKKPFSDAACADVENGIKILENLFQEAMIVVETGDENNIAQVEKDKNHMRKVQKQYNKAHLNRIKKKQCSAELTADYSRLLYSMDRIADNCVGIAEEAMEQVPFVKLYEENARQEAAAGGKR